MRKGFLLIDAMKNSVLIPLDNEDLVEYMQHNGSMERVVRHSKKTELWDDISHYLNGTYKEGDERI